MSALLSPYVDTSPNEEPSGVVHAKPVARPSTLSLQITNPRRAVRILDVAGSRFGVTWEELLSRDRTAHLANARHVAAWLMRQAGMSYPAIGRALGGRDHTTAMHAVARIEREAQASRLVRDTLADMLEECGK